MFGQLLSRRRLLAASAALPLAGPLLAGPLLAGLSLAACSSTPPRLFTLASVSGRTRDNGPKTLTLTSASIPRYLDKPQIVRYSGAYEMEASQTDRWSEPFGAMIDRVIAENLAQRLPNCTVYPANSAVSGTSDVTLEIDIARFDIQPDGSVALAAQWGVRTTAPGIEPFTQSAVVEAMAASAATPDAVAAMSKALGGLSDQIVLSLPLMP